MSEVPLRLTVGIFGDPDDFDRDGKSVSNLCDEVDALVLSFGFTLTEDCMIERGVDPLADDTQLAKERDEAVAALEAKQSELIGRADEIDDAEHFAEIKPYIDRVVRTQQGFHV